MLLKRNLRAAGDKAKPTGTFMGNAPPVPSSGASWLPRTHLLLAPEDHSPVEWGTTMPVSLCFSYAGGRNTMPLQESERICRYQLCNFNRDVFLISLHIPFANERAIDACGKWRAGSSHRSLHTLFIILGSSSVSPHSRAYEQKYLKRDCDSDIKDLTVFSRSFAPVTESSHPFQKKQSPVLLPVSAVECFATQYVTVFIHVPPPHPLLGVMPA